MSVIFADLLAEVRSFRAEHPDIRYVDLIALDIPGHFYGKRYPMDMLEKVAAGAPLKLPQNCVLLGTQGGLYPIGDYCFADGDPDAARRLVPGTLKPVRWEKEVIAQMLITSDGTAKPIEFEPREVLARVIQRLAKRGIRPVVAFELEFYLFNRKLDNGLPQYPRDTATDDEDDQPNMHIERLSRFSSVLHEMVDGANEQGVPANVITAEPGPWPVRDQFLPQRRCPERGGLVGAVLPQYPRYRDEARLPRQLHEQAVSGRAGQRHACAREPV